MKNRYGFDGVTYHDDIDASTGHIKMDEEPRVFVENEPASTSNNFNEPTKNDKFVLNQLFQDSSVSKDEKL